jgi:uncharacterized membrane protein
MSQLVQVVGAVLILSGFALTQTKTLDPKSLAYLCLNAVGSGVLAANALVERQWGFVLLNATWFVIAVVAVIGVLRRRRPVQGP